MKILNDRFPRAIELAVTIVAGHVRRSETAPAAFAALLESAYRGIRELEREHGKLQARAGRQTAQPASPDGADRPVTGSGMASGADDGTREGDGASVPVAAAAFPPDARTAPFFEQQVDPERDRVEGYIRNGVTSVTAEHIIFLDSGRRCVFLGRYLKSIGVDPADYRRRWGLPADYPMTAPAYVERRRAAAKLTGFGSVVRPDRETKAGAAAAAPRKGRPERRLPGRLRPRHDGSDG